MSCLDKSFIPAFRKPQFMDFAKVSYLTLSSASRGHRAHQARHQLL